MEINPEDKSQLTREILLGFHTQFAENQRSREQSFLRILAFLAIPVGAYAYAYHYYFHPTNDLKVGLPEFYLVQALAVLLIFAGTWTLVIISNNFRRDQFVNAKIREVCDLLGDSKIFPDSYNPKNSLAFQGLFKWMPDFLLVFFFLFIAVQASLLYVFYDIVKPVCVGFGPETNWTLTVTVTLTWLLLIISLIFLPFWYRKKIIEVMKVDKTEYNLRETYKRCFKRVSHKSNNGG